MTGRGPPGAGAFASLCAGGCAMPDAGSMSASASSAIDPLIFTSTLPFPGTTELQRTRDQLHAHRRLLRIIGVNNKLSGLRLFAAAAHGRRERHLHAILLAGSHRIDDCLVMRIADA